MAVSADYAIVKLDDAGGTPRQFADGDIASVDIGNNLDEMDVSGFGQEVHSVIYGQINAAVTLRGYLTTTANIGTHTVIRDAYQQGKQVTLEVQIGSNAPPVAGDPKFSGEFLIESYRPMLETGKAVQFTATLKPATGTAPVWGTV